MRKLLSLAVAFAMMLSLGVAALASPPVISPPENREQAIALMQPLLDTVNGSFTARGIVEGDLLLHAQVNTNWFSGRFRGQLPIVVVACRERDTVAFQARTGLLSFHLFWFLLGTYPRVVLSPDNTTVVLPRRLLHFHTGGRINLVEDLRRALEVAPSQLTPEDIGGVWQEGNVTFVEVRMRNERWNTFVFEGNNFVRLHAWYPIQTTFHVDSIEAGAQASYLRTGFTLNLTFLWNLIRRIL